MQAPKCRLCGSAHYGPCNTFAANDTEQQLTPAANIDSEQLPPEIPAYMARNRYRNADARRKYQRDLMRRRRLKSG